MIGVDVEISGPGTKDQPTPAYASLPANAERGVVVSPCAFAERLDEARRWLAREAGLDEQRLGVIGSCIGGLALTFFRWTL